MSRRIGAWLIAVTMAATMAASAQTAVPPLTGHVIDQTGTLSAEQGASLEQALKALEARKGSQVAILMVASTAPEAIEPYALRVAEQWKLGRKQVDDGAILVVAKDDRAVRLEVGYGLEGSLTDLTSQRIISQTILPRFKQQDYFGGISAGVAQIVAVIDGEPLPPPQRQRARGADGVRPYAPILFVLALALGGVLRAVLGMLPGALLTGGLVAVLAWFLVGAASIALGAGVVALFVTLIGGGMVGRGLVGYYGGGRAGGGFSGGGGGFGGGGASGRW